MSNYLNEIRKRIKPFSLVDLFGFLLIISFCFFSFQHGDMTHTIQCSISYLSGHVADFYDFNARLYLDLNYLPSTYLVFALWGLPLKILGLLPEPGQPVSYLILWYKVLTTLVYFASGYLIKLIGEKFDLSQQSSKLFMALWMTTPLAIFSQFIFGQYDIFTVFLMLLGIYYYLQGNLLKFTFAMGLSLTFKYFPIFVFVPMLLLKEKELKKIIFYCSAVLLFLALEILPYIQSPAFRHGIFGFVPSHRVLHSVFKVNDWEFSIFFFGWLFICAYSYLKELPRGKEFNQWAIYLGLLPTVLLFSLVTWHPQWLIIITPFLAICAFFQQRSGFFYLIDLALMYEFVNLCIHFFPSIDQSLWIGGVFAKQNPGLLNSSTAFMMKQVPPFIFYRTEFSLAVFCAALFVYAVFSFPKAQYKNWIQVPETLAFYKQQVNQLRFRFYIGVSIWIAPAAISYSLTKYFFSQN